MFPIRFPNRMRATMARNNRSVINGLLKATLCLIDRGMLNNAQPARA
jgi:hypothetical protein